uniref:Uncharacterized protein n=1 Tax=Anopheles epiroticus TaxID=199890 RepID=A0A182P2W6_9DIPT
MAVTLKQEVNLSRRACRPTAAHGSPAQRTLVDVLPEECNSDWRQCNDTTSDCGAPGANNGSVVIQAKQKPTADSCSLLPSCLLAALVMCTGQVLLQPRLGRLCIYVVLGSALLSHNAFVLARPNLSAPASGEKVPVGQLSPLDLAFDASSSGSLTSASQLKRSAEAAAIIASPSPSADVGDHGEEMAAGGHGRAGEGEGGEHGGEHVVDRYPVSQVDFSRVETPFVIGVWILSASIAKI